MPTLAKTSPFAPSRKGAPCYFLCESHRYAGNNRWVLWPHARNASGKFRFFQVLEPLIACNAGPGQLGRWNANPITLASAQVARSISCAPCRVPLHHFTDTDGWSFGSAPGPARSLLLWAVPFFPGPKHSQCSQRLQAAHSFTPANSVALVCGTSPKQTPSITQSVSKRCASTVNADEITKCIDGFIQQPTLSRVLLVPIRVVPGVFWRNVRLATRRAVIPVSHCLCGLRSTAFAGWFEWHKS